MTRLAWCWVRTAKKILADENRWRAERKTLASTSGHQDEPNGWLPWSHHAKLIARNQRNLERVPASISEILNSTRFVLKRRL